MEKCDVQSVLVLPQHGKSDVFDLTYPITVSYNDEPIRDLSLESDGGYGQLLTVTPLS